MLFSLLAKLGVAAAGIALVYKVWPQICIESIFVLGVIIIIGGTVVDIALGKDY